MENILLTFKDAARALAISESSLYRLTAKKAIPVVKIGRSIRYRVCDLEAFAERQLEEAPSEDERQDCSVCDDSEGFTLSPASNRRRAFIQK